MKPQNTLRIVSTAETDNTQHRQTKPHKELKPPHFPEHPQLREERPFGTLSYWLEKLGRKG